jgi:hypothetical protein
MCTFQNYDLNRQIEEQSRLVRGLTAALHAGGEPDESLWRQLVEAKRTLVELQRPVQESGSTRPPDAAGKPKGNVLGVGTTQLRVVTTIQLEPIPTGIYHHLDPRTDPLLTVTVQNESFEPRRVCVTAYIEGLSARAVKTVELGKLDKKGQTIPLLPSLIPEQARRITEVQRGTLQVEVVDLDNKVESQDSHSVVLLARTSSFNSVIDPVTGRMRDLTKYYAAWVTPHVEPVQALVRKAADKVPDRRIWGYQGRPDPEATAEQVRALFETLKVAGIVYVDSVIDFGAGPCQTTQRTRLPRESLRHRSANCIDGTVLFASLLESASLHAAIVLVPGHAFVAWETWRGTDDWDYLETTMIGSHDFEAARQRARSLYQKFAAEDLSSDDSPIPRVLKLNDLRAQRIWPME